MIDPIEIQNRLERVLLRVQKPGRYVGGELNQVDKDWDTIETHCALIFPDIYDIGLPNLGVAILYDQINRRADALAERAYAPWFDMEAEMRKAEIPLVHPAIAISSESITSNRAHTAHAHRIVVMK